MGGYLTNTSSTGCTRQPSTASDDDRWHKKLERRFNTRPWTNDLGTPEAVAVIFDTLARPTCMSSIPDRLTSGQCLHAR